ncbi:lytic murein transglycosylase [Oryzibacter oryziterrae]|uniref:lytic murein transglycosylase n=1 Tax=Oryzibacter oryziterrae TaxID=2766474 RepID=UPI001F38FAF9|nr:lytic murein transglycosylase [Oryzibacter oryziterrae]
MKSALHLPLIAALLLPSAAAAATCSAKGDGFDGWLAGYKGDLTKAGVAQSVVDSALAGVSFDPAVIKKDRGQGVFSQTFAQFAGRMVNSNRLQVGAQKIAKNADLFARIEQQYGVPAPVIVAVWGLESDFGANTGTFPTLQSLATLAYDCRRPVMFQNELVDALQIVARGDLTPEQMKGAWAGELGQTQFLPSNYVKYAVDFDGDGRRDLIKSSADVLASTANYLHSLGWAAGQPWLVEVNIPGELPWDQADLEIKKPVSEWQNMGITGANGSIPAGDAALYLPMGRYGPAFLAYHNFDVYLGWNESLVYSTTAAYFATRLAGAPPVGKGNGVVEALGAPDIAFIQKALAGQGMDPGPIDGKLGLKTRLAVRAFQIKAGLPADGWPDSALLSALR